MLDFRPHIMLWTPTNPSTTEPGTGNEIPGAPGETIAVPCRFYLGGTKVFKNEDSTDVQQKGKIRLDAGVKLPAVGVEITVTDVYDPLKPEVIHFQGRVMDVYRGQLSYRIDV
jgi:hypothetical protein